MHCQKAQSLAPLRPSCHTNHVKPPDYTTPRIQVKSSLGKLWKMIQKGNYPYWRLCQWNTSKRLYYSSFWENLTVLWSCQVWTRDVDCLFFSFTKKARVQTNFLYNNRTSIYTCTLIGVLITSTWPNKRSFRLQVLGCLMPIHFDNSKFGMFTFHARQTNNLQLLF